MLSEVPSNLNFIRISYNSKNIVYLLYCDHDIYKQQYVEITQQKLCKHLYLIWNKTTNRVAGGHFNVLGQSMHHMKFSSLEQVKSINPLYGRVCKKFILISIAMCPYVLSIAIVK